VPRYRVTNRRTHETYEVEAPYARDACETLGWQIGHCYVQKLREGPYTRLEPAVRTGEGTDDGAQAAE